MTGSIEDRLARRSTVRRAAAFAAISAVIALSVVGRALTEPAPRSALGAAALAQPVGPAGAGALPPTPDTSRKAPRTASHSAPGSGAAKGTATRPTAHGSATAAPSTHHLSATPRPAPATQAPSAVRTVLGAAYDVSYGLVQVRVTFRGRTIADVSAVSLPQGGRSSDISAMAAPRLRREALAAQSAGIDAVSGASYTSAGYAKSLQSAIDRAGA